MRAEVDVIAAGVEVTPSWIHGGAAIRAGTTGWFLADDDPPRAIGHALAWAHRQQVVDLHVLAEEETGLLARRAALFVRPPKVWRVQGRSVVPAVADPPLDRVAAPEPLPFAALIAAAGADVVVEHGTVTGEVLGLEIARVVETDEGPPRLEVGVGRHDREAFAMIHGDVPPEQAMARVVAEVRRHRCASTPDHPLTRLVPERWLRAIVLANPERVGASALGPVEGVVPRVSIKDRMPAIALGTALGGRAMVVACSVGIDLDLVPAAADARLMHDPDAILVLVVPARDDHEVTRALAAALAEPARIVSIPGDWRADVALS